MSAPGTPRTIAHYELLAKIGAGGMGEVYRARDSKLGRDVAIKVLPAALASESDYLVRLQREAHLLASINHPNIAGIYGLEDGAIVMELVEGPTIADRLRQGPLATDEALTTAMQIAGALEAAHEKGIIHRDLKPANVKITPEGVVKVLDFGLAKAVDAIDGQNSASSPTMTIRATQAGLILGTAAYMSPEQAAGKVVDRRSDIWSFGVVLWEMLTGRRMFDGETISHTLADVLRAPIDFDNLPAGTPASIHELLRRCLDRDLKTRLQWIGEARIAIQRYLANPSLTVAVAAPKRSLAVWIGATAAAVCLAIVAAVGWYRATRLTDRAVMRFSHLLGSNFSLRDVAGGPSPYAGPVAVISPDGSRIAFVASAGERRTQLYLSRLDQSTALPIEHTEGAAGPFFSADGEWIGFFAGGKLKKISINGGVPAVIADIGPLEPMGAAWAEDGSVIAALGLSEGLVRINPADGSRKPITSVDAKTENSHRWPQVLPGGKAVLFTGGTGGSFESGNISVQRLDTGERKVLHRGGTFGRYLPGGQLAFVMKGMVFAAPFDFQRLEMKGTPVEILQDVKYAPDSGGAQLAFSEHGTLIYRQGTAISPDRSVYAVEGQGSRKLLLNLPGIFTNSPVLSPDGTRLALLKIEGPIRQLWVFDVAGEVTTRLTFDSALPGRPRWSPDGRRIIYARGNEIYWQRADGAGSPVRLINSPGRPIGMTPDGHRLLFMKGPGLSGRCWVAPVSGDGDKAQAGKDEPCFDGDDQAGQFELSPDGKWLAFVTSTNGRFEVYVRSFPDTRGKWQVSAAGGTMPAWSPGGNELFYLSLDDMLMVAPYRIESGSFISGRSRQWSPSPLPLSYAADRPYSITPDGKRVLLMANRIESSTGSNAQVNVVLNFFDEVKRKLAGRGAEQ